MSQNRNLKITNSARNIKAQKLYSLENILVFPFTDKTSSINLSEKGLISDSDIDNSNTSKKPNKSSNQLNTEGKDNKKSKMSQIIDYFNEEEEAEIVKEYNKMKKTSKNISKKNNNEKYELMLRRLLDQQNIKMIGPKRRQTIRKEGNKIQTIVHELLKENKDDILKGNKNNIGTLIIKQPLKKKGRASMTIDKNSLSIPNNKRGQNFFKKRNSLNEMINKVEFLDFQKHKTINCQADC